MWDVGLGELDVYLLPNCCVVKICSYYAFGFQNYF